MDRQGNIMPNGRAISYFFLKTGDMHFVRSELMSFIQQEHIYKE